MVGGNSARYGNRRIVRVLFGTALLASIIFLPWWVSFMVAICASLVTEHPYEILVFGFLSDLIYADFHPEGLNVSFFLFDHFIMTLGMAGIVLFSHILWQRTRWKSIITR